VQIVAALAGLLSVVFCWVVSVRLLLLARRTRQAPELLIGLGLLLAGGLWSPLMAVGRQATTLPDALRAALVIAGALCGLCGMSCIAIFNWRVFRPSGALPVVLVLASIGALVGIAAAQTLGPGWLHFAREERGPWTNASALGAAIYLWSCIEAGRQHAMLKRRLRIGLADPVVTDRMRIFTLLMSSSFFASSVFAVFQTLHIPVAGTTLGLWLTAAVSILISLFLCLAFVPPAGYLDLVRRRAAAEA
jgi:hypothetical protein